MPTISTVIQRISRQKPQEQTIDHVSPRRGGFRRFTRLLLVYVLWNRAASNE